MNKNIDLIETLVEAIEDVDLDKAHLLFEQELGKRTAQDLFFDVLNPALNIIGDKWKAGEISLAQGYVAGKFAEQFFTNSFQSAVLERESKKGCVVIGNIEDDFHSLGRKLVTTFLKIQGWDVHDLGNDVNAETFIQKAIENSADIIAVSAMITTTASNIAKIREILIEKQMEDRFKIVVGGAIFNIRPELAKDLGADATASTALEADEVMLSVLKRNISNV